MAYFLKQAGIRDKIKLFAAGKLVTPGRQIMALCLGADACYTARGFMLALGCIQALQCNKNTCPVGITTHNPHLQAGLDIAAKAQRIANYANCLLHDHNEIRSALGVPNYFDLSPAHIRLPYDFPTAEFVTL
ncbi:MAG: glutamate synthase-related protein [bacterium]|nr:glutamate synthase-related protein [bacterium]